MGPTGLCIRWKPFALASLRRSGAMSPVMRSAEYVSQPLYRLDAGMPTGQSIVGDDQIGPPIVTGEARQRCAFRFGGDDEATPASQQSAHGIAHQRIVVDDDNELAPRRIGHGLWRNGVLDRLMRRSDPGQGDRETRASAERRDELEPMIEQTA